MASIYMGNNSNAKIPLMGRVNSDYEILSNAYATAYDEINGVMLTRSPSEIRKATVEILKSRFAVIKSITRKYNPSLLDEIQAIERLTIANATGSMSDRVYIQRLRHYVNKHGLPAGMIANIENQINAAEGSKARSPSVKIQPLFQKTPMKITPGQNIFIPKLNFMGRGSTNRKNALLPAPISIPMVRIPSIYSMPRGKSPGTPYKNNKANPWMINIPRFGFALKKNAKKITVRYPNVPTPKPIIGIKYPNVPSPNPFVPQMGMKFKRRRF